MYAYATVLGMAWTCGCGGAQSPSQGGTSAASAQVADEEQYEGIGEEEEAALIPAQTLDEIERFFDRKRRTMVHCFTDALSAGEIGKRTREAWITVSMTITPAGKATSVSIADASVDSPVLATCVKGYVGNWVLPAPPEPLDYSYRFGFSAL